MRTKWQQGLSGPMLCEQTRAPSSRTNSSSASISGRFRPAAAHNLARRSRVARLCSSMTRRAGWSFSASSTAAFASAQPRPCGSFASRPAASIHASSCLRGLAGCWCSILAQNASDFLERRRRYSATSASFEFEVAVERHLVGAGRFRDRVHADRANTLPVKQVRRRNEDALAGRNYLRRCQIRLGTLGRNSRGHAS